jgi:capsule polysaccharide modification protein KpsS
MTTRYPHAILYLSLLRRKEGEKMNERAIKRAIAVKQYRFLLKMVELAEEKKQWRLAIEWKREAEVLKEGWNL